MLEKIMNELLALDRNNNSDSSKNNSYSEN